MPVYKRGSIWWVVVSHAGQRFRASAGKGATRADAKALERKLIADIHEQRLGRKPRRLISEALLYWLDNECQSLKSPRKYESHARAIVDLIQGKTLEQAPQVAEDIKHVLHHLSPITINRRIAILRRVCNLAYRSWGWLDEPVGDRITLMRESSERHVYLTPRQVENLANHCRNPNCSDMIRLAAYTGLRRGELFRLTAGNFIDGMIVLDGSTKSGRPRMVPVPPEVEAIAKRLPLPVSDAQLRKDWDRARSEVGMPGVRFHDLRHTYASWLVQSGVPMRAVQELLGHATLTMTQRYSHLAPDDLRRAVRTMTRKVKMK